LISEGAPTALVAGGKTNWTYCMQATSQQYLENENTILKGKYM